MKDFIKNNYKYLLGAIGYIVVATIVYGVFADSLWHKWFLTLITCVVVVLLGLVIAYFYIKEIKNEKIKKEEEKKNN